MNPALSHSDHFDLLPLQVWTARADGSLDFVNAAVSAYFRVDPRQILDQGWKDLCHPFDLITAGQKWQESVRTGAPYEVYFRLLSGAERQFRWHVGRALPVRSALGTIEYWVGCNTDIDAVKREEEVARAASAQARGELERATAACKSRP